MFPQFTASDIQKFWRRVAKGDGCWLWTGGKNNLGYGRFYVRQVLWRAHRVAWILERGEIPVGLWVLHHCDNPSCVRPDHLFLGTPKDNTADMYAKGRAKPPVPQYGEDHWSKKHPDRVARGERSGAHTHPERRASGARQGTHTHPETVRRGERHNMAILSAEQVRKIRGAYKPRVYTRAMLARDFGVSEATIDAIIDGRLWKSV